MDLFDVRFTAHNVNSEFQQPENISDYFHLTAPPNTKIWRKPGDQDDTTAPMILTTLEQPFILAEVTVSAEFEMDWDQGGLVIFAGSAPGQPSPPSALLRRRRPRIPGHLAQGTSGKWVKAGLEFTGGELGLSTVVANPSCGSDWSFIPAFPHLSPEEAFSMHMPSLRIKFERVGDDLWVWYRLPDSSATSNAYRSPEMACAGWKKAREVMGFFYGIEAKSGVWVGCYASRPAEFETEDDGSSQDEDGLFVEFEDLEIL